MTRREPLPVILNAALDVCVQRQLSAVNVRTSILDLACRLVTVDDQVLKREIPTLLQIKEQASLVTRISRQHILMIWFARNRHAIILKNR